MSEHKDQEYFADGLSEEILNLLAGVPTLSVIEGHRLFNSKGKTVTCERLVQSSAPPLCWKAVSAGQEIAFA